MKKKAIILIDDESIVLQGLRNQLENSFGQEYIIEVSESGHEAIEVFTDLLSNDYEIPLVICDFMMPGMKGDELLGIIHTISDRTVNVMLTGQADVEGIKNAINNANLFKYIEKPWNYDELLHIVSSAIELYYKPQIVMEENKKLNDIKNSLELNINLLNELSDSRTEDKTNTVHSYMENVKTFYETSNDELERLIMTLRTANEPKKYKDD